MTQPYPLTQPLTPDTRKRLPLRLRSNGLRGDVVIDLSLRADLLEADLWLASLRVNSMRLPEGCLEVVFTDFGSQNREFPLAFCHHGTVSSKQAPVQEQRSPPPFRS
jgi:hypothetical protein